MEEEVEQEEQERDAVNRRSIPLKRPDCCYRCRWRKFPKKNLRIIGNDESIRLILIFFRININDTSTASVINHDWTNVEIIQLRNSLQTLKKRYQHLKTKKKVLFWRGSARWLHYPILWWHSRNTMNESSWFFLLFNGVTSVDIGQVVPEASGVRISACVFITSSSNQTHSHAIGYQNATLLLCIDL